MDVGSPIFTPCFTRSSWSRGPSKRKTRWPGEPTDRSGPEGCRSAPPTTAKGVDPRHGAGGKRVSASQVIGKGLDPRYRAGRKGVDPWHRAGGKGLDPRPRRPRKCSIRGMEQAVSVRSVRPRRPRKCSIRGVRSVRGVFDPWVRRCAGVRSAWRGAGCKCSIRMARDRASVRSGTWSQPDGCQTALPATEKGLDPATPGGWICSIRAALQPRKCSIHGMEQAVSVRSVLFAVAQVFDPGVRTTVRSAGPREPEGCLRETRCCAGVRSAAFGACWRCSIRGSGAAQVFDPRGVEQAASVRSAWPATAQVFDPLVRQVFDPGPGASRRVSNPRLRRLRRVSIRRHPVAGSVRSAPPAAAQVFDPRYGAGRICSIGTVSIEHPAGRGVRSGVGDRATVRSTRPARRATVRSAAMEAAGSVRSAPPVAGRVFDPGAGRARWCSLRGSRTIGNVRPGNQPAARFTPPVDRVW